MIFAMKKELDANIEKINQLVCKKLKANELLGLYNTISKQIYAAYRTSYISHCIFTYKDDIYSQVKLDLPSSLKIIIDADINDQLESMRQHFMQYVPFSFAKHPSIQRIALDAVLEAAISYGVLAFHPNSFCTDVTWHPSCLEEVLIEADMMFGT